jgi:hypothetical protein
MKRFKLFGTTVAITKSDESLLTATASLHVRAIHNVKPKLSFRDSLQEFVNWLIRGDRLDYGVVSRKCVTTAGVRVLMDCLANTSNSVLGEVPTLGMLKYHFWGTGTGAESVNDTFSAGSMGDTLQSPTGPLDHGQVGTIVSATVGANATLTSVATIIAGGSLAITEHAIAWQRATPSDAEYAVLFDRTLFSVKNVTTGNGLQFTYVLTMNSGG